MSDVERVIFPSMWSRVRAALTGGPRANRKTPGDPPSALDIPRAARLTANSRLVRSHQLDDAFVQAWSLCAMRRVSLSLLVIEMDRFGEFGRAYGQAAAESCLASIKTAIRDGLPRPEDVLARQGRHSFVAVLPDYPLLMARATAQRIAANIAAAGIAHKDSHRGVVTVSAGIAVANPAGLPDRTLFTLAQAALEKAKRRGLNRIESIDRRGQLDTARLAG